METLLKSEPFYKDEFATIYCGESEKILPTLLFDVIVTDPPYGINLGTNYHGKGMDDMAVCHDYLPVHGDDKSFDPRWLLNFNKPTVLWGANYFADKLPPTSGWLVWDKVRYNMDQAEGELAWTNFVKGVRIFKHLWNGMWRGSEVKERYHPTQKPVALSDWILDGRWFPEKGIVADPYMGSGSLLVAAKRAGRQSIGIEYERSYCELAAGRLVRTQANTAFHTQRRDRSKKWVQPLFSELE